MKPRIILAQPAILRFSWELEVLLTNLALLGSELDVILLFSKHDDTVPRYLSEKYGIQCFVYEDLREDKKYIASIKPYLWWQFLKEDPAREKETYFYIDSDIIFRELIDFSKLGASKDVWVGSDCGAYLDYDYLISRRNGEEIVKWLAEITGITTGDIKKTPGAGAQWVISKPTAAYWERVYKDSTLIYDYLNIADSDIQVWTAEMWAQLFGAVRIGKTIEISSELDFCRPTDNIKMWDMVKILHNAGVVSSGDLFFKGIYTARTPFNENFDRIRRDKCSLKYVQAIKNVVR